MTCFKFYCMFYFTCDRSFKYTCTFMPNTHRRLDLTVELSRVGRVYGTRNLATVSMSLNKFANSEVELHPSAVVTQFTIIFCAAEYE